MSYIIRVQVIEIEEIETGGPIGTQTEERETIILSIDSGRSYREAGESITIAQSAVAHVTQQIKKRL